MLKNTPSKVTLNYQETQDEPDPEGYTHIYEQEIVCHINLEEGEQ